MHAVKYFVIIFITDQISACYLPLVAFLGCSLHQNFKCFDIEADFEWVTFIICPNRKVSSIFLLVLLSDGHLATAWDATPAAHSKITDSQLQDALEDVVFGKLEDDCCIWSYQLYNSEWIPHCISCLFLYNAHNSFYSKCVLRICIFWNLLLLYLCTTEFIARLVW